MVSFSVDSLLCSWLGAIIGTGCGATVFQKIIDFQVVTAFRLPLSYYRSPENYWFSEDLSSSVLILFLLVLLALLLLGSLDSRGMLAVRIFMRVALLKADAAVRKLEDPTKECRLWSTKARNRSSPFGKAIPYWFFAKIGPVRTIWWLFMAVAYPPKAVSSPITALTLPEKRALIHWE